MNHQEPKLPVTSQRVNMQTVFSEAKIVDEVISNDEADKESSEEEILTKKN